MCGDRGICWMIDSSKGNDAAEKSPAPLLRLYTRAKPTSPPTLLQERRQKSSDVLSGLWVPLQPVLWSCNSKVQCMGKRVQKDGNSYLSCVTLCSSKCVCACVHACAWICVHVCVCDVSVCHRVSSFPFTAPWQQCQTRAHMICVCLWEYVCVCVWLDSVFILLSSPFHLRSLGCPRVLSNGQSRPAKLAFGSGTELDA